MRKRKPGDHAQLNYRIWLRWDNDYYYIAAEIDDYDGYYNKRSHAAISGTATASAPC